MPGGGSDWVDLRHRPRRRANYLGGGFPSLAPLV